MRLSLTLDAHQRLRVDRVFSGRIPNFWATGKKLERSTCSSWLDFVVFKTKSWWKLLYIKGYHLKDRENVLVHYRPPPLFLGRDERPRRPPPFFWGGGGPPPPPPHNLKVWIRHCKIPIVNDNIQRFQPSHFCLMFSRFLKLIYFFV